ncbi:MAG: beta-propeller fold lactonase family protein, partial [bacterium]|nr:beta-propeller fold lactonase family protein [bacterium]
PESTDLDGSARIVGSEIDLGAFENDYSILPLESPDEFLVPQGGELSHSFYLPSRFTGVPDAWKLISNSNPSLLSASVASEDAFSFVETLSDGGTDGAGTTIDGLRFAHDVTVSPDGKHVYAVGMWDNAVAVFELDPVGGELQFIAAYKNGGTDEAGNPIASLDNARSVRVSPDGRHVMVAASIAEAVTVFARDETSGRLTVVQVLRDTMDDGSGNTVMGIDGVHSLALSDDGLFLYTAGLDDHALAVFRRNPASGVLTFVTVYYDGGVDDLGQTIDGLREARWVTLSPDGKSVYLAGRGDDALAVFDRDRFTGKLEFVQKALHPGGPACVSVSSDGKHAYATGDASSNVLVVFSRDQTDGTLTSTRVYHMTGTDQVGNSLAGLDNARAVTVSGDGRHVYVAGYDDHVLLAFSRDLQDGTLTLVRSFATGEDDGTGSGGVVEGLGNPQAVAVSPDGVHIFTANQNHSLSVFSRDSYAGQVSLTLSDTSALDSATLQLSANGASGGSWLQLEVRVVRSALYVDAAATGNNTGQSWTDAFPNLQDALAAANSGLQDIWMAAGTYYPDLGADQTPGSRSSTFRLQDGMTIYGGFPADGSATRLEHRDIESYPTILSGDLDQNDAGGAPTGTNAYHVVTGSTTDATAVLDGHTITGGMASGQSLSSRGGGLFCFVGSPTLKNCTFAWNSADDSGGAACLLGSSSTFISCLFRNNTADFGGGAMFNNDSFPILTNCQFLANQSSSGGALRNQSGSDPVITNCVFSGNRATNMGAAMFNSGSSPSLINCTLSGNWATTSGGAVHNSDSSSPVLTNCILWNNRAGSSTTTPSASVENVSSSSPTYAYCLVANLDLSSIGINNFVGSVANN